MQLVHVLDAAANSRPRLDPLRSASCFAATGNVPVRISTCLLLLLGCCLLAAPAAQATQTVAPGVVTTTPELRQAAANAALAKVGSPYHGGGNGPRRFDCSGLVTFAYRVAKHPLIGRTSFELWNHGAHVRRVALQPGDLVWTWDQARGHVGIYVGAGRYVHAPGTGRRVENVPLPTGRAYLGAVRP